MEARRELNEVANCFLEVQNANTVFNAWSTVDPRSTHWIIATDLEYLNTRKNEVQNDNASTKVKHTLNN